MNKLVSVFTLLLSLTNLANHNNKTPEKKTRAESPFAIILKKKRKQQDLEIRTHRNAILNKLSGLSVREATEQIERLDFIEQLLDRI